VINGDSHAHRRQDRDIAYRLSTIRRASRIIVIDEEGIHESGDHDELLAQNYAELYRAQNE
jgi:ATP-binding cassette subfamily B protein